MKIQFLLFLAFLSTFVQSCLIFYGTLTHEVGHDLRTVVGSLIDNNKIVCSINKAGTTEKIWLNCIAGYYSHLDLAWLKLMAIPITIFLLMRHKLESWMFGVSGLSTTDAEDLGFAVVIWTVMSMGEIKDRQDDGIGL